MPRDVFHVKHGSHAGNSFSCTRTTGGIPSNIFMRVSPERLPSKAHVPRRSSLAIVLGTVRRPAPGRQERTAGPRSGFAWQIRDQRRPFRPDTLVRISRCMSIPRPGRSLANSEPTVAPFGTVYRRGIGPTLCGRTKSKGEQQGGTLLHMGGIGPRPGRPGPVCQTPRSCREGSVG